MKRIQPGSIVVGADGSPDAGRAVSWAAAQAALEQRPLAVVTIARPTPPLVAAGPGAAYVYPDDAALDRARLEAGEAAALASGYRPGISVRGIALTGDPHEVLVEISKEAHLLVLGSRGRGRVRSRFLGSVSASVSKHATCPVVVCRPGLQTTPRDGVLVGADGTPGSLPVIEFAFRQASLHGEPLTVLHCFWDTLATVDGPHLASPREPGIETQRLLLAESVAGFSERFPDVDVTLRTARGRAEDCLAGVADVHALVVVGRHPLDTVGRRLTGALSTEVIERSHTNVVVVPEASSRDIATTSV